MSKPWTWTAARADRLASLWDADLSATQIAAKLGAPNKNVVIGKAYRMGLPSRPPGVHYGTRRSTGRLSGDVARWCGWFLAAGWDRREIAHLFGLRPTDIPAPRQEMTA